MVDDGDVKEVTLQSKYTDDHAETSVIRIFQKKFIVLTDGVSR